MGADHQQHKSPARLAVAKGAHFLGSYGKVGCVGVLILLLSLVDGLCTLALVRRGSHELNPLLGWCLAHGTATFIAAKLGATLVVIVLAWRMLQDRWLRLLVYAAIAVYAALDAYYLCILMR